MDEVLSADLSAWGILKWFVGFMADSTRRQIHRLRRAPSSSTTSAAGAEDPGPAARDINAMLADLDAIDVSVMIAMPTPPRLGPQTSSSSNEEVLGEFVVGITRLSCHA
jgi:hypothetical protein